jgi:hypothetical protein
MLKGLGSSNPPLPAKESLSPGLIRLTGQNSPRVQAIRHPPALERVSHVEIMPRHFDFLSVGEFDELKTSEDKFRLPSWKLSPTGIRHLTPTAILLLANA